MQYPIDDPRWTAMGQYEKHPRQKMVGDHETTPTALLDCMMAASHLPLGRFAGGRGVAIHVGRRVMVSRLVSLGGMSRWIKAVRCVEVGDLTGWRCR